MKFLPLLVLLLAAGCATQRGFPPREQIVNFDKVSADLYRGGQPNAAAIQWLRGQGIKSIINLRQASDAWPGEAEAAEAAGIVYINIPWSGISAPSQVQVNTVLDAIAKLPKPVFLHCQHGCDRTGTAVACYRIRVEHRSNAWALREAIVYKISPWLTHMREFIKKFK